MEHRRPSSRITRSSTAQQSTPQKRHRDEGAVASPKGSKEKEKKQKLQPCQISRDQYNASVGASAANNHKEALKHARTALRRFPDDPIYLVRAAQCLRASGYESKGIESLKLARKKLEELTAPSNEQIQAVSRAWRMVFPFDNFPSELVKEIFDYVYSSPPLRYPLIALQICSSWRRLALKQTNLWTNPSIFPKPDTKTPDTKTPRRNRNARHPPAEEFCVSRKSRMLNILRICDETSGHTLSTIEVVDKSCYAEFSEIVKVAIRSASSLVTFVHRRNFHFSLCRECHKLSSDATLAAQREIELTKLQLKLAAEARSLATLTLTLYASPGADFLAEIQEQMQDRKTFPHTIFLALRNPQDQFTLVETIAKLLSGVKNLVVTNLDDSWESYSTAACWKAAALCSRTLESLSIPLPFPRSGSGYIFQDLVREVGTLPHLTNLVLLSDYFSYSMPLSLPVASRLCLPSLRSLRTEVEVLQALDVSPAMSSVYLEIFSSSDVSKASALLETWKELESLTIRIGGHYGSDAFENLVNEGVNMLLETLTPVGRTSANCPRLQHLSIILCGEIEEYFPTEYLIEYASSGISHEEWKTFPALNPSPLFKMEFQRRRASQGLDPTGPTSIASSDSQSAFRRGQGQSRSQPQTESVVSKWAPCSPIERMDFALCCVDPDLWAAFVKNSPCQASCQPDPLVMAAQLLPAPTSRPSHGERRIHPW